VHHETHVRLVESHSESAGGHNDIDFVLQKVSEAGGAAGLGEPRVIGDRAMAGPAQRTCDRLGGAAGGCVDDCHDIVAAEKLEERLQAVLFIPHLDSAEPEIGTVERPYLQGESISQPEHARNLISHAGRGAPGQGDSLGTTEPISRT
jgi:hypothetical protein